ncbi:MAG: zinc-dependent metalloprotease [Cyanobacteriota bacterium]|nr:zinc-dependent metalloprotease [Cyanobacteriota bacterium]
MKQSKLWVLLGLFVLSIFLGSGGLANFLVPPSHARMVEEIQQQSPKTPQNFAAARGKQDFPPFEEIVKNAEKQEGLFPLYQTQDKGKLYLEIPPDRLDRDYLCIITLSRGLGEGFLLNGLSLDNFLFRFRRVGDKVQFVLPNINFRADAGDPVGRSLVSSFSDSVLYVLDIQSIHPERQSLLVDLSDLLLSGDDLAGLSQLLSSVLGNSYVLDGDKSYFGETQAFPLNLEIEAIYGFSAKGNLDSAIELPTVPDRRAFNLAIHYSFSELSANNGYVPRLADERVGYFISAYKDLSNNRDPEPFVRYIQRWQLEATQPDADISTPKQPIVFWIENTVPLEYRQAVRDGILMWNAAFEQAGFKEAIAVQQMPDDATWDPADVRYNTIRWSSSLDAAFLGIGPSHVNPLTGQILDADIVIDANVVRSLREDYQDWVTLNQPDTGTSSLLGSLCGKEDGGNSEERAEWGATRSLAARLVERDDLCFGFDAKQQFNVGAIAQELSSDSADLDKYINQFIRYLVAHEVGHTLGLRHNFHGSTLLMPQQLNDTSLTQTQGLVSSVMDYVGVNLAPQGVQQGDYFPIVVGPYDRWAVEYGYKPSGANLPELERRFLEEIARRSSQSELDYATDEDVFGFLDPQVNTFDLSADVLLYAQWQMDNAKVMWERLPQRYPKAGEGYSEMRGKFNAIFSYYFQQAIFVSNYIGGSYFNRDRPGNPNARLPFEPVPVEKQREALTVMQKYVFSPEALNFPPELLNQLAPSRWNHWGASPSSVNLDYPILDNILLLQRRILRSLLSEERLQRLRNLELKTEPEGALTLPELFETLQEGIWTEVWQPREENLNISSIRRAIQREYLDMLVKMVLRRSRVPEDARTLAWYQLDRLEERIDETLGRYGEELDAYSSAHLAESRDRIAKALDAPLESKGRGKAKGRMGE